MRETIELFARIDMQGPCEMQFRNVYVIRYVLLFDMELGSKKMDPSKQRNIFLLRRYGDYLSKKIKFDEITFFAMKAQ